jgi:hypothetical protein
MAKKWSRKKGSHMKIRKLLLLGCAALASVALAAPAAASAAGWQHEGVPLAEHAEIGLFGSEIFVTEAGGLICEVDATLTAEPGSTGQIGNYESTKCQGLFGEIAGCTVVSAEQTEGPWTVHVTEADLDATGVTLTRTFDPECPVETIESHIPELTLVPVEPAAIAEIEYSGEGEASIDGGPAGEYQSIGSWFVAGEASGTYGIG